MPMFLEVAAAGEVDCVVTGNLKHFPARGRGGVSVVSPRDFLTVAAGLWSTVGRRLVAKPAAL